MKQCVFQLPNPCKPYFLSIVDGDKLGFESKSNHTYLHKIGQASVNANQSKKKIKIQLTELTREPNSKSRFAKSLRGINVNHKKSLGIM